MGGFDIWTVVIVLIIFLYSPHVYMDLVNVQRPADKQLTVPFGTTLLTPLRFAIRDFLQASVSSV